jgi:DNA-binding MarR family transcriptional regulator
MENDTRALDALFADASLGAPENAVGFVLWRLVHRYQREADRALAPLDLTQLQFMTLTMAAWLARSGEPVPQAALSRFGDIHPMQLSHMLKALAAKGLVTRTHSAADVRAKCVEVTAAGRGVLRQALPVVIEVQQRLFGDQGAPGGELLDALVRLDREHLEA